MAFTEEQRLSVWNKATTVDGFDPKMFRKDACGAWIIWDKYGVQDNIYGWEIDHIVPKVLLEQKGFSQTMIDDVRNLRALQHQNNESKGDDYPSYTAAVTSENNKNIEQERNLVVNNRTRTILGNIYKL